MTNKRKLKAIDLDEKIKVCQEYTQFWAQFFNLWGDGFEGRRVTSEDEAKYFKIITVLARKLYRFDYMMQKEFTKAELVQKVLSGASSLSHIHDMTDSQFGKFQLDWHVAFLAMNKCLGKLNQRKPASHKGADKAQAAAKQAPAQAQSPSAPQQPTSSPPPPPQG